MVAVIVGTQPAKRAHVVLFILALWSPVHLCGEHFGATVSNMKHIYVKSCSSPERRLKAFKDCNLS